MDDKKEVASRLLECMAIISYSDGHLDESESEIILNIASRMWNGNRNELKAFFEETVKQVQSLKKSKNALIKRMDKNAEFFSDILDDEGKKRMLILMEELINADKQITKEELNLFNRFHNKILSYNTKKVDHHEGYKGSLVILGISLVVLLFGLAHKIPPTSGYLTVAVAVGYIIWDKFLTRRCSVCRSKRNILYNSQEIDRWLGRKTVHEKTASGKSKSKNVQTTYVKMKRSYRCNDCGHEWIEITKEEK